MSPAVLVQRGASGGGATVDPDLVGGRLSLLAGKPLPTRDQIGISTLRWVPVGSGRTALWNASTVEMFTETADVALALAGLTNGQISDVFLWNNAGTRALELQVWAGHGQVVTGATNATPVVITAAGHGLQNGDEVYLDTLIDNPVSQFLSSKINDAWIVANRTTNTFELAGSAGLDGTYFRGGYFSARLATGLLTMQNGMCCKIGQPTRRYVGTIRATSTSTTEDSLVKRFVWNAHNQVERTVRRTDMSTLGGDHPLQNVTPVGPTGYRPYQEGGIMLLRVEWVQGLAGQPVKLMLRCGTLATAVGSGANGPGPHVANQIGLDGTPLTDFATASNVFESTNDYRTSTLSGQIALQAGYHFADLMEAEHANFPAVMLQGVTNGVLWG